MHNATEWKYSSFKRPGIYFLLKFSQKGCLNILFQIKRCVDITANKVIKLTEYIQSEINKTIEKNDMSKCFRDSSLAERMTY